MTNLYFAGNLGCGEVRAQHDGQVTTWRDAQRWRSNPGFIALRRRGYSLVTATQAAEERRAKILDGLRELAGVEQEFNTLKSQCRLEFSPNSARGVFDHLRTAEMMDLFDRSMNCTIEADITEVEKAQPML